MARGDFEVTSGAMTMRVEGLGRTLRAMSKAGADAEEMRELMHAIGTIVVRGARPPRKSGALATSIRAGRGKTKAVVRAGGARVPYAGVQHYGWPARNIAPSPFLTESLQANRAVVLSALDAGLADLLRQNDLT